LRTRRLSTGCLPLRAGRPNSRSRKARNTRVPPSAPERLPPKATRSGLRPSGPGGHAHARRRVEGNAYHRSGNSLNDSHGWRRLPDAIPLNWPQSRDYGGASQEFTQKILAGLTCFSRKQTRASSSLFRQMPDRARTRYLGSLLRSGVL
jgi:hypothetical protein